MTNITYSYYAHLSFTGKIVAKFWDYSENQPQFLKSRVLSDKLSGNSESNYGILDSEKLSVRKTIKKA